MKGDNGRGRVAERLAAVQSADESLGRRLEAIAAAGKTIPENAIDRSPLAALDAAASALREIPAGVQSIVAAQRRAVDVQEDTELTTEPAAAVEATYLAVGRAIAAAAALFTTGRLMFVGEACDFAVARMQSYADVTKALNALLPQAVALELRDEGLVCNCVCPMCSLGACGCIWASLHNIDLASGGPGLAAPDEQGIPLRSPPRPRSALAGAKVRQWDRVTAVDGEPVRSPGELQAALQRHALGDEIRVSVERDGKPRDIVVRHSSGMP